MPVASEHEEKICTARITLGICPVGEPTTMSLLREDSTTTCPRPSRTNLPCRPTSTSTPSPVLETVPGMLEALEMISEVVYLKDYLLRILNR